MIHKTIVSMFDESGNMLRPWAEAGYQCWAFDILNVNRKTEHFPGGGAIRFISADLFDEEAIEFIVNLKPVLLFGFPPCTDLAVSGARHFDAKFEKNPQFQIEAVRLCRQVEVVGDRCGCPWMAENPVSVLSTMWRKPNFKFHPNEYGGYLEEDDVHPRWPEYITARDAYPKLTCIWSGNGFSQPLKKIIPKAPGYSTQFHKLGGKSAKTKQIRSETPRGYAKAVFVRHHGWIV